MLKILTCKSSLHSRLITEAVGLHQLTYSLPSVQGQDPEKGCHLQLAQEMVTRLAQGLHEDHKDKASLSWCCVTSLETMNVTCALVEVLQPLLDIGRSPVHLELRQVCLQRGNVDRIAWGDNVWNINNGKAFASCVYITTGAHPKDHNPYPRLAKLDLDDALIPSKLAGKLLFCALYCPAHVLPCFC